MSPCRRNGRSLLPPAPPPWWVCLPGAAGRGPHLLGAPGDSYLPRCTGCPRLLLSRPLCVVSACVLSHAPPCARTVGAPQERADRPVGGPAARGPQAQGQVPVASAGRARGAQAAGRPGTPRQGQVACGWWAPRGGARWAPGRQHQAAGARWQERGAGAVAGGRQGQGQRGAAQAGRAGQVGTGPKIACFSSVRVSPLLTGMQRPGGRPGQRAASVQGSTPAELGSWLEALQGAAQLLGCCTTPGAVPPSGRGAGGRPGRPTFRSKLCAVA